MGIVKPRGQRIQPVILAHAIRLLLFHKMLICLQEGKLVPSTLILDVRYIIQRLPLPVQGFCLQVIEIFRFREHLRLFPIPKQGSRDPLQFLI